MELRQLKYFIAISDSGSFSKAAEQAHVVQSALSQQIAALEAELDVQLLVRSPRGITLTAAGQLFYQQAQHLLRQVEHVKAQVREGEGRPGGPVSIGLPNTTAAQLSLPLLEACLTHYPGIALHIMEGMSRQLHQAVTNASVDMVIQFSGQPVHGLKVERLATEELFLISSAQGHAKAGGLNEVGDIDLAELRNIPLLLPERGNGLRDLLDKVLLEKGLGITPLAELGSAARLAEAAVKGVGATLLPWGSFHEAQADGKLRVQRIRELKIQRDLLLCVSSSMPLTNAASAVCTLVRRVVKDVIRTGIWQAPDAVVGHPLAATRPGQ